MKRILVSILLVLYMAGACSATVHLHYCMGEIAGVSLVSHEEHKCGKCGMVKKAASNGCCEDVQKTLKTAEHCKAALSFTIIGHELATIPLPITTLPRSNLYTPVIRDIHLPAHPPPNDIRSLPLYIQVRNLRI